MSSVSIVKANNNITSRTYILDIPFLDRRDSILKFNTTEDQLIEGFYQAKFVGLFSGGYGDNTTTGAPPIAYLETDIAMCGLQKIHKLNFISRPIDRPGLASVPAADPFGYVASIDQIESLILPSSDTNANNYEAMFFYEYDNSAFGYYIDIELIINLTTENPIYVKWGSAVANKQATLLSSSLQLTSIEF